MYYGIMVAQQAHWHYGGLSASESFWFGLAFTFVVVVLWGIMWDHADQKFWHKYYKGLSRELGDAFLAKALHSFNKTCRFWEEQYDYLKAENEKLKVAKDELTNAEALIADKDKELNDLEKQRQEAELEVETAAKWMEHWKSEYEKLKKEQTPEWYRAMLLEQCGQINNLEMLNKMLTDQLGNRDEAIFKTPLQPMPGALAEEPKDNQQPLTQEDAVGLAVNGAECPY